MLSISKKVVDLFSYVGKGMSYFDLLPTDLQKEQLLLINWKDIIKICAGIGVDFLEGDYERVSVHKGLNNICTDKFWVEKTRREFPLDSKNAFYKDNFYNYLAARARYLDVLPIDARDNVLLQVVGRMPIGGPYVWKEIFGNINAFREKAGLSPLLPNISISKNPLVRVVEMYKEPVSNYIDAFKRETIPDYEIAKNNKSITDNELKEIRKILLKHLLSMPDRPKTYLLDSRKLVSRDTGKKLIAKETLDLNDKEKIRKFLYDANLKYGDQVLVYPEINAHPNKIFFLLDNDGNYVEYPNSRRREKPYQDVFMRFLGLTEDYVGGLYYPKFPVV